MTAGTPPAGRSRTRRLLFRGLAVLGGLAVAWLLLEIVLLFADPLRMQQKRRLVNHADSRLVAFFCYPSNPNGELRPLPDVSRGDWQLFEFAAERIEVPLERLGETPWCFETRLSSQGFRDREFEPTPPPGTVRVVGMGDSFAAGDGVPLELSLFKQMERLLGGECEILNAARPGYNTRQEADQLPGVVTRFRSERAIVVFIPNDVEHSAEIARRGEPIHDLITLRVRGLERDRENAWYAGHSRVLDVIGSAYRLRRLEAETLQWYRDAYDERFNAEGLRRLEDDLRLIASTPDCEVVFVLYPLLIGFEDGYPLQDVHDRVGALARAAGLPVLDLAPAFAGEDTASLHVHPTDQHPNGRAHAIAAAAVVEWLRRDVPGFLDR